MGIPRVVPEATTVLVTAKRVAAEAGCNTVNTGHVLLGILRTTNLLSSLQADANKVERMIQACMAEGEFLWKQASEEALLEARSNGIRVIDPLLLLAGLCRTEGSIAHRVLTANGITLDRVRSLRLASESVIRKGDKEGRRS